MATGQLVWLITGTSSGLGRHLVNVVLARGDRVIATVRKLSDAPIVPAEQDDALHAVQLDVSDSAENVKIAVDAAVAKWGKIDVLVNNAGYTYASVIEEASPDAWEEEYRTNVFGTLNVTNAVLPYMRARRSGTVILLGSRMTWQAQLPLMGFYSSSKAAVHALGEAYATELRSFGIRVCVVAPGGFRTNNTGKANEESGTRIEDYDQVRAFRAMLIQATKFATGDPHKAMDVLVDAVRGEGKAEGKELPMILPMGSATYDRVRIYCKKLLESMDEWEGIAKDLDLDEVPS